MMYPPKLLKMHHKTYKNRGGYKEILSTETPYFNIATGQRFFIDPDVVPPKQLLYVEDLNPYQRTISIVMDSRQRRIIKREKEKHASSIYGHIKRCLDKENSQQLYGVPGYEYPVWFDELIDIMYFGTMSGN